MAHYQKTLDPILPHCPHPDTGVSWDFVFVFALKGDPMGRRQAINRIVLDPAQREHVWRRWHEERADWIGREEELT
jgi:hypothetical protein